MYGYPQDQGFGLEDKNSLGLGLGLDKKVLRI